ncbi:MAG: YkgJ family cysteine cluster protein [Haloferacaceae archaeon]
MNSLEAELELARELDVAEIADVVESIGFACTRCGACCTAEETDEGREPHTATVFPDEIRRLQGATGNGWRDVARPMPYGLDADGTGETFEWALSVDGCGDCSFYTEEGGVGACTVHDDRPLVCRTYPFSIGALSGEGAPGRSEPAGGVVREEGPVRAHECAGLGRDISRTEAEELAEALRERAIREIAEAIDVRDTYRPVDAGGIVVHDSEGQKRPDGEPLEDGR